MPLWPPHNSLDDKTYCPTYNTPGPDETIGLPARVMWPPLHTASPAHRHGSSLAEHTYSPASNATHAHMHPVRPDTSHSYNEHPPRKSIDPMSSEIPAAN